MSRQDANAAFALSSFLQGTNAAYIDDLYARYEQDPSSVDAEWQECLLKASFLRDCDPGLKLIETLRRDGGVYPMWAGHLARLRRSAAYFGFPLDEQLLRVDPALVGLEKDVQRAFA